MLKRSITYTDFNDNEVTEDFYFNLSKADLIELEFREDGSSLKDTIEKIVKAENKGQLIRETKHIVLSAYGVKSEDGKRFEKSPALTEAFTQTAAFQALYSELILNDTELVNFINGIMPRDVLNSVVTTPSVPTPTQIVESASQWQSLPAPPPPPQPGILAPQFTQPQS